MEIKIRSFALIRELIGHKLINLNVSDNSTIRDVISHLIKQYPNTKDQLIEDNNRIVNHKLLLKDNEVDLNTKITENDTLFIIPPTGGG